MRLLFVISSISLLASCASRFMFTLSDADVKRRYANTDAKPSFRYIPTEVGNVYCVTKGDSTKPPLVLVHGAPGHWYSSMHFLDDKDLLKKYFIITYDRPGYGHSYHGYSVPYIDAQTAVLRTILEQLGKQNDSLTLLGRSYGTPIAARYAMVYPQYMRKLFLIASTVDPKNEKYFWFSYANLLTPINHWMPHELNSATDEKFIHAQQLRSIEKDWNKITTPTYIMHGKNDNIADTINAYYAQRMINNADTKLYMIDNTKHNVAIIRRDMVKKLLLE
jgi:pimeloyl-ACP methyl ester carboxylesterase